MLVNVHHEGNVLPSLGLLPAAVVVSAAAAALCPPQRFVWLGSEPLHRQDAGKLAERCGSAVVGHLDDVACASMHLQRFRWGADRLLEQPTVKLKLQRDLDVVLLVNLPRQLGITNEIAIAVENQEVWTPNDADLRSVENGVASELALVENRNTTSDRFQGSLSALLRSDNAQVHVSAERGEMALFVPLAKSLKDFLEYARFGFRDALLAQIDAERTQGRSVKVKDVGSRQLHEVLLTANFGRV